jgi:phosphomannomutase
VWADSANLGKAKRLDDAAGRYIEFCKSTFSTELTLKGLKIVVDAAHGAAYHIAPKVFHELGAEVIAIGCAPDGLNINHEVGATHPDALVRAVKANKADYGIALDGDADRLQLVDASGRLFNGDELLYLMVDDRLRQGEKIQGVVGTLMTNMAVELNFVDELTDLGNKKNKEINDGYNSADEERGGSFADISVDQQRQVDTGIDALLYAGLFDTSVRKQEADDDDDDNVVGDWDLVDDMDVGGVLPKSMIKI